MKVSFIIVAYNAEVVISRSLSSLKQQDYPHNMIEVILVDGLSTDRTKSIMTQFQSDNQLFSKIIVKDNPGKYLACGWNIALEEATGDIILRVDAHTTFPIDFISKNVKCIEQGESICGGKVVSILEDNSQKSRVMLEAENSMFGGGFTFFRRGEVCKYTSTLAFAAYKRECFINVGKYDERLVRTEDNDMHYRMRKAGYRFFFNPDIVSYRYCRNSFRQLIRQKYLNGFWVGKTMWIQPKAFSIFYFVPLAFVIGLMFCAILVFLTQIPLCIFLIAYFGVLILSLLFAIKKSGFYPMILLLPAILFSLHFVYGIGTIAGLCSIPKTK